MFEKIDGNIREMYENKKWLEAFNGQLIERFVKSKYYILVADISLKLTPVGTQSDFRQYMKSQLSKNTYDYQIYYTILTYISGHCKNSLSEQEEIAKLLRSELTKIQNYREELK